MGTEGKTWTTAVDSPEQIQMCLNCTRSRCVDCIGRSIPDSREVYRRKTKGYKNRMLNPTAREVLNLYRTAKNDRDIAEKIGRPIPTVTGIRLKFGLPPIRNVSVENRNKLVDEWLSEMSS